MRARTFLAMVVGLVGCHTGYAGVPSATGTTGQVDRVCEALCGRLTRCGNADASCRPGCHEAYAGGEGRWSAAFTSRAASCLPSLACSASKERCIADFETLEPGYSALDVVRSCLGRRSACRADEATFADDYCFSLAALTAEARARSTECTSRPCEEVPDCLRSWGAFEY